MQHQTRSSLLWISTLVVGIATQLGCEHPNQIKITAGGGNKPMLDAQDGDEITWVNIAPHFLAASPCKSGDIKPCKVELKGKYGHYRYTCDNPVCPDPELEVGSVPNDMFKGRSGRRADLPAVAFACQKNKIVIDQSELMGVMLKQGDSFFFENEGSGDEIVPDWTLMPVSTPFCRNPVNHDQTTCNLNVSTGMYMYTLNSPSNKCQPSDPATITVY